jgi:GNAT superfamily N-acetyltransferase
LASKDYQITHISEEQISLVGGPLTDAFFADPLMTVIFPHVQERIDVLTWYFKTTMRALAPFDGVYTTAGTVNGIAAWVPPGVKEEALVWEGQAGLEAYKRYVEAVSYLGPLRQSAMPGPFWYLSWLAVAPTHQGKGLGSALLAPGLEVADQQRLPCYLETFVEKNLLFYQRHGFEMISAQIEPESKLPFWTMRREPHDA